MVLWSYGVMVHRTMAHDILTSVGCKKGASRLDWKAAAYEGRCIEVETNSMLQAVHQEILLKSRSGFRPFCFRCLSYAASTRWYRFFIHLSYYYLDPAFHLE
jgi:hypothetical protein